MRTGALALLVALTAGCGTSRSQSTSAVDASDDGFSCSPEFDPTCPCKAGDTFQCCATVTLVCSESGWSGDCSACDTGCCARIKTCPNAGPTTISGTIYDPANINPLFNVTVYVPLVPPPLPALPNGVSCSSCFTLFTEPVASAVTDATGHFSIPNAPDGENIPIVVQIGKWRMVYNIAHVTPCQDNPQPDHVLHLPKNHFEGDLPNIAVSTGAGDSLECLLLRMGVAASEFTGGAAGPGRIHIFSAPNGATTSGGTSPDPGTALWGSDADINQFDVVLLSCEGVETMNMNQQVLMDYANGGGRVFASHFHYAWFNTGPFTTMINPALATWTPGAQPIGNISGNVMTTLPNGMPFPEGVAMNAWLGNVRALVNGELPIVNAFHNSDVSAANTYSQAWISADNSSPIPNATEDFSFDFPVGVSAVGKCGRVVYSDMHVSGGAGMSRGSLPADYASGLQVVPDQCATGALSPQEKALEFIFFDLSSCSIPDPVSDQMPPPSSSGGAILTDGSGSLDATSVVSHSSDGSLDSRESGSDASNE